jgi:hypothetical protein
MPHFVNQRTQSSVISANAVFWTVTSVSRRFRWGETAEAKMPGNGIGRRQLSATEIYWSAGWLTSSKTKVVDQGGALPKDRVRSKFWVGQEFEKEILVEEAAL